jgi:hypothetical protein
MVKKLMLDVCYLNSRQFQPFFGRQAHDASSVPCLCYLRERII